MKLKTKEFKKNNYFVLYEYEYLCNLNHEDEIVCYFDNWEELHKKCLKNYRVRDLVYQYNKNNTNIITIIINNRKYKLATFNDTD